MLDEPLYLFCSQHSLDPLLEASGLMLAVWVAGLMTLPAPGIQECSKTLVK